MNKDTLINVIFIQVVVILMILSLASPQVEVVSERSSTITGNAVSRCVQTTDFSLIDGASITKSEWEAFRKKTIQFDSNVKEASSTYKVPESFLWAIMNAESKGRTQPLENMVCTGECRECTFCGGPGSENCQEEQKKCDEGKQYQCGSCGLMQINKEKCDGGSCDWNRFLDGSPRDQIMPAAKYIHELMYRKGCVLGTKPGAPSVKSNNPSAFYFYSMCYKGGPKVFATIIDSAAKASKKKPLDITMGDISVDNVRFALGKVFNNRDILEKEVETFYSYPHEVMKMIEYAIKGEPGICISSESTGFLPDSSYGGESLAIGKYYLRPHFKTSVEYDASEYDEIQDKVSILIEECDDPGIVARDCIQTHLYEFSRTPSSLKWTLDHTSYQTKEERECFDEGDFPLSVNECESCDDIECSEVTSEKGCIDFFVQCGTPCEWQSSQCVAKLTDEESICLSKDKYIWDEDFRASCEACSDEKCSDYRDEKFCELDPCDLRCVPQVKEGLYTSCGACPAEPKCEEYTIEAACTKDLCNATCKWENDACVDLQEGELKPSFDEPRSFVLYAVSNRNSFEVFEEGKMRLVPAQYSFALLFKSQPPVPPVGLELFAEEKAEGSVIMIINKSPSENVEYYNIFTSKGLDKPDLTSEGIRFSVEGVEELSELDLGDITFDFDEGRLYYKVNSAYRTLERNTPYAIGDQYIYILDGLNVDINYNIYVTAGDSGNNFVLELSEYEEGKSYARILTEDNLAPRFDNIKMVHLDKGNPNNAIYYQMTFDIVGNEDGSEIQEDELMMLMYLHEDATDLQSIYNRNLIQAVPIYDFSGSYEVELEAAYLAGLIDKVPIMEPIGNYNVAFVLTDRYNPRVLSNMNPDLTSVESALENEPLFVMGSLVIEDGRFVLELE